MGSVVGPYPLLPSSIHCRPASAAASQQPAPAWCSHSLTQPSLPLLSAMRALTSSLFALVTRLQMAVVELCVAEHAHSSTVAQQLSWGSHSTTGGGHTYTALSCCATVCVRQMLS
jgi:hypothetical protein